jgi:hypothetical protein
VDCRRVSQDVSRQKCRMGGSGMPGTRPPRIVPLRGLSRQLEQSLQVIQGGLRSPNRRLEGRAEKRAFLRERGFEKGASLHWAVRARSRHPQACGLGGWPGPHLFCVEEQFATDFTDRDWSGNMRKCFPNRSFLIDVRFYFTYTPNQ